MGFFYNGVKTDGKKSAPKASAKHIPIELMNQMGCKACPLDKADLTHPKMEASGVKRPLIYILGEAPGKTEDEEGEPFVGESGQLLRSALPRDMLRHEIRIHNTIRCRPPENRNPELVEIECCRGYIERDIEEAKPLVVVGVGGVPLAWATGYNGGISKWRGRLIATRIGKHSCWYFPVFHPSYVLRNQSKYGKSEVELCFEHDLDYICGLVSQGLAAPPRIYDSPYDGGIEIVTGQSSGDLQLLEDALNRLAKEPLTSIDLETTGLRPYPKGSAILTCAIGTFDDVIAFPLSHPESGWGASTLDKVYGLLLDYLMYAGRKIAHHVGFEMEWLAWKFGTRMLGRVQWEDTLSQAHTLDQRPGTNSLDSLTRQYFGFFLKDQSRVDASRILEFPLKEVLRYNGMDSKWDHKLFLAQDERIRNGPKEYQVEYERKLALADNLVRMQLKGIVVDESYAKDIKETMVQSVRTLEDRIRRCPEVVKYQQRFGTFKPTSPDDVIKLMKEICQRTEVEKEGGGSTSDESVLSLIPATEVPSAPLILEHRAANKMVSTYIDPVVTRRVVMPDNRIHTTYSSMIAETSRLASEDPNIQNFPKHKFRDIRGMIVAPGGYWIVAADYGQIEARVIAMASEDQNLVKYLWTGYDIHGYWADRFIKVWPSCQDWVAAEFEIPRGDEKKIRKQLRQEVKNRWVFPQFFGSSYKSCAAEMHVPDSIAKEEAGDFWDEFQGVQRWQKKTVRNYERNLYVETLDGFRRRGPLSLNQIINTPIQGTAAHIVCAAQDALCRKADLLEDDDLVPCMNQHDDLTFYLPDDLVEDKIELIVPEMCMHRFDFINVPLIVEVSASPKRWNKLEEIATFKSYDIFPEIRNPYHD